MAILLVGHITIFVKSLFVIIESVKCKMLTSNDSFAALFSRFRAMISMKQKSFRSDAAVIHVHASGFAHSLDVVCLQTTTVRTRDRERSGHFVQ